MTTGEFLAAVARTIPDLVLGAPNLQDTTRTCDAISFGFKFATRPIPSQDAAEVREVPLSRPACEATAADAGTEAATDASAD